MLFVGRLLMMIVPPSLFPRALGGLFNSPDSGPVLCTNGLRLPIAGEATVASRLEHRLVLTTLQLSQQRDYSVGPQSF